MKDAELAKQMAEMVKNFVAAEIAQVNEKLVSVNQAIGEVQKNAKQMADALENLPAPVNGVDGKDGKDGLDGKDGADGAAGKDGAPGSPGQDGSDGRDALALEILPDIDPEKSYARGTFATHQGGLWRSFSKTQGMRGWECIVDGIAAIDHEYDGERAYKVSLTKSSGLVVEKTIELPNVIDRGVWKPDHDYKRFDGVTYAGSFWIAQKDAPEGVPGTSDGFRLAVKKGRDANPQVKAKK